MRRPLVVDKSFANSSPSRVAALSEHYHLVVPSAFYYEVLTTDERNRVRELRDFPPFQRINVYKEIQRERELGCAVELDCRPCLETNPVTLEPDWVPTAEDSAILMEYEEKSLGPWLNFWVDVIRTRRIPGFTCEELSDTVSSDAHFTALCATLRNESRIRRIAEETAWPYFASLDCRWFHYRFLQTAILHGFVLLRRYPNAGDMVSRRKLEHDYHDLEYLTVGLFVKALATSETSNHFAKFSMEWRYRILEPRGIIITF